MNSPLFTLSSQAELFVQTHVVVDSLVNGTSSGGVRIVPDLEVAEVQMLAAEMTLKYAFSGLLRGGAKCGIRMSADLGREERLRALEDVGRRLKAVITAGIYYPGMDMNCGPEELRAIYRGAGITLGDLTDTSFYTAVFVAQAVRATAEVLFTTKQSPLTLAVEGFGAVASHLAAMLEPERFQIVALSTARGALYCPDGYDPQRLRALRATHGDALIDHLEGDCLEPKETLLSLAVDILIPAARVGSIHGGNAHLVSARCVVPAANAPCTSDALASLQQRGIPVLPGFVCNVGGVLGSSLFDRGVPQAEVEQLAAGPYRLAIMALLRRSLDLGLQPSEVARRVAMGLQLTRRLKVMGRLDRFLSRLGRRVKPVFRFAHRHALRDCERHFLCVEGQLQKLVPLGDAAPDAAPVVSIIMPVYASEQFLAEAVRSVLAQTWTDFELLVLDDGSPGDVPAILSQFHDPRIVYRRFENSGPAVTRNRGLAMVRGQFIAFLDSDDWWREDKLARQLALFSARPEVDIVYSQRQSMDETGLVFDSGYTPRLVEGDVLADLYIDSSVTMSSAVMRRKVPEITGGFNEALPISSDWEFWLRAACFHRFAADGEALVRYRTHPSQISRQGEKRVQTAWQIRPDFDRLFGHLVPRWSRHAAKALHHRGKAYRAELDGQGLGLVAREYARALLWYPRDVAAWKGLLRILLPGRTKDVLHWLRSWKKR